MRIQQIAKIYWQVLYTKDKKRLELFSDKIKKGVLDIEKFQMEIDIRENFINLYNKGQSVEMVNFASDLQVYWHYNKTIIADMHNTVKNLGSKELVGLACLDFYCAQWIYQNKEQSLKESEWQRIFFEYGIEKALFSKKLSQEDLIKLILNQHIKISTRQKLLFQYFHGPAQFLETLRDRLVSNSDAFLSFITILDQEIEQDSYHQWLYGNIFKLVIDFVLGDKKLKDQLFLLICSVLQLSNVKTDIKMLEISRAQSVINSLLNYNRSFLKIILNEFKFESNDVCMLILINKDSLTLMQDKKIMPILFEEANRNYLQKIIEKIPVELFDFAKSYIGAMEPVIIKLQEHLIKNKLFLIAKDETISKKQKLKIAGAYIQSDLSMKISENLLTNYKFDEFFTNLLNLCENLVTDPKFNKFFLNLFQLLSDSELMIAFRNLNKELLKSLELDQYLQDRIYLFHLVSKHDDNPTQRLKYLCDNENSWQFLKTNRSSLNYLTAIHLENLKDMLADESQSIIFYSFLELIESEINDFSNEFTVVHQYDEIEKLLLSAEQNQQDLSLTSSAYERFLYFYFERLRGKKQVLQDSLILLRRMEFKLKFSQATITINNNDFFDYFDEFVKQINIYNYDLEKLTRFLTKINATLSTLFAALLANDGNLISLLRFKITALEIMHDNKQYVPTLSLLLYNSDDLLLNQLAAHSVYKPQLYVFIAQIHRLFVDPNQSYFEGFCEAHPITIASLLNEFSSLISLILFDNINRCKKWLQSNPPLQNQLTTVILNLDNNILQNILLKITPDQVSMLMEVCSAAKAKIEDCFNYLFRIKMNEVVPKKNNDNDDLNNNRKDRRNKKFKFDSKPPTIWHSVTYKAEQEEQEEEKKEEKKEELDVDTLNNS